MSLGIPKLIVGLLTIFKKTRLTELSQKAASSAKKPEIFGILSLKIVFINALAKSTRKALEKLDSSLFFKISGAYLAGGTALALHLKHRYSEDLDFFTKKDFIEETTIQLIDKLGNFQLNRADWKTILGKFEDTKFSLFYYKYPLIKKAGIFLTNTPVVSIEDIAAMKIAAIADRGTKRDFIDLFFLARIFTLKEILEFYDLKYKNLAANKTHIFKSIIYFADAQDDPMPRMVEKINWEEVETFFEKEASRLAKDYF